MTLQSFLRELRAHRKVQQALAAGRAIDGVSTADHLAAMELMVHELEHGTDEATIATHDEMVAIVSVRAPLKHRLEGVAGFMLSRRQ